MHTWRDELDDIETYDSTSGPDRERVEAAVRLVEEGPGAEQRAQGITRLGQLGARYDLVERSARSKSTRIRAAAALALGGFPDQVSRRLLSTLLADEVSHVRSGAAAATGRVGMHELLSVLIGRLEDAGENIYVKGSALVAAARLARTDEEIERVAAYVEIDEGPLTYRDSSIAALGILGDADSIDALREALDEMLDGASQVPERLAAQLVRAIGRHFDPVRDGARFARAAVSLVGARSEAARVLVAHPIEIARPALEQALAESNPKLAGAAVDALCALGIGPSLDAVRRAVLHTRSSKPLTLIKGLQHTPAAAPLLVELTREASGAIRAVALGALHSADPEAALTLAQEYVSSTDIRLRDQARRLLSGRTPDAVTPPARLRIGVLGNGEDPVLLAQLLSGQGHAVTAESLLGDPHQALRANDAEVIVLAGDVRVLNGTIARLALRPGQIVVDATVSTETPGLVSSLREHAGVRVVKAFTAPVLGALAGVEYRGGRPLSPLCGDDDEAVAVVSSLVRGCGADVLNLGGLEHAATVDAFGAVARELAAQSLGPADRVIATAVAR